MSIKKQVLLQTKNRLEKKLAAVEALLIATPLTEIVKIRIEARQLINSGLKRDSKDFLEKLNVLSKREKQQIRIFEASKDSTKLVEQKVEYTIQLGQINSELYSINYESTRE